MSFEVTFTHLLFRFLVLGADGLSVNESRESVPSYAVWITDLTFTAGVSKQPGGEFAEMLGLCP